MTKTKAFLLAALTLWPFLFFVLGWLIDLTGLLSSTANEPPVAFVLFMVLLSLTALMVPALVVFYIVYLLTRPQLPMDRKLVWAAVLVIGHVFIMPVVWYLFIWNPREFTTMQVPSRFSLLVFAPLLILLLLPLTFLFPFSLFDTFFLSSSPDSVDLAGTARLWAWVAEPIIGAIFIFFLGRLCYTWFHRMHSLRLAWIFLWAVFSLLSMPVIWYATVVVRGMVPSDAPPNTPSDLTWVAIVLALVAQPFIMGWLFVVSRKGVREFYAG